MTTDAAEEDLQFRRRNRRTRWIAALSEGAAAAIFIAILLSPGRLGGIASGIAFGAVALVAYMLWPMTFKEREFPLWRLTAFGVLVVFFGAYLWLLIVELSLPTHLPDVSHLQYLWKRYSEPGQFLRLLMNTLGGSIVGVLLFGILTIPTAIGIAWLAVILGNPRLDPK